MLFIIIYLYLVFKKKLYILGSKWVEVYIEYLAYYR